MVARGRGGIIIMSSLAAETGAANVALYSATKAFDLVLAEGLWYELRDHGVDVVAIRPGSTRTPGWQSSQPPSGDLAGVMEPADVVRDALAALGQDSVDGRGRRESQRPRPRSVGMARRDVIELMSGITAQLVAPDQSGDLNRSACQPVRSSPRLRRRQLVGKLGEGVPDVAEDFEQCFLSLDADAFGDPKRQLLYCRQHVVEDSLRSWGDVDEHPSPVVTIVAAHDVVLAFEIVEQGGHGATGDVHARRRLRRSAWDDPRLR